MANNNISLFINRTTFFLIIELLIVYSLKISNTIRKEFNEYYEYFSKYSDKYIELEKCVLKMT